VRVSALSWTRYRSFKERQRVELAPVTLIIGRNGSGKSVISRLPVLLASGVDADATDPLDLSAGGVVHAATYQDLVHSRSRLPFSLGAEVSDGDDRFEFETSLRYVSELRSLTVEAFWLSRRGERLIEAVLSDEAQLTSPAPRYNVLIGGQPATVDVSFIGLLPSVTGFAGTFQETLSLALAAIRQALPAPSYLGPFRVEAGRSSRSPGQRVRQLGPRGEQAIELLAEDQIRFGGELVRGVSEWFTGALKQGTAVDVHDDRSRLRVVDHRSMTEVLLADTGAGFSQVLPVVVQHYAFRKARLPASTLIVEQPELHLHPGAHGAVMDLALETVSTSAQGSTPNCLFETHSEQIIMRLRRRIAEGFDPGKVALWSLNHRESDDADATEDPLRVIRFDASGDPDSWPVGVFEEALDDLTALRRAAREREQ
jgi:predicted ATPase